MVNRRAATRPATPRCVDCLSDARMACVVRTGYTLYFRCEGCGTVTIIPKRRVELRSPDRRQLKANPNVLNLL
jgi:hypothetical protein